MTPRRTRFGLVRPVEGDRGHRALLLNTLLICNFCQLLANFEKCCQILPQVGNINWPVLGPFSAVSESTSATSTELGTLSPSVSARKHYEFAGTWADGATSVAGFATAVIPRTRCRALSLARGCFCRAWTDSTEAEKERAPESSRESTHHRSRGALTRREEGGQQRVFSTLPQA